MDYVPAPNHNTYGDYKIPQLDHFDIIEGSVGAKVTSPATVPADGITGYSAEYKCDSVTTTKVIARFGKTAAGNDPNGIPTTLWTSEGNGYYSATLEITVPNQEKRYYRLRGSDIALNTPNEMDACGNPLPDTLMAPNTAIKAFDDLWFYSNPVFVSNGFVGIKEVTDDNGVQIYPNPATGELQIKMSDIRYSISDIVIYDMMGKIQKTDNRKSEIGKSEIGKSKIILDVSDFSAGIYIVQIKTDTGNIIAKKFVKE
jgi:hypothetical protein